MEISDAELIRKCHAAGLHDRASDLGETCHRIRLAKIAITLSALSVAIAAARILGWL
jgi:hypothetical protein